MYNVLSWKYVSGGEKRGDAYDKKFYVQTLENI